MSPSADMGLLIRELNGVRSHNKQLGHELRQRQTGGDFLVVRQVFADSLVKTSSLFQTRLAAANAAGSSMVHMFGYVLLCWIYLCFSEM